MGRKLVFGPQQEFVSVGGETFPPTGFIGPWMAKYMWRGSTAIQMDDDEVMGSLSAEDVEPSISRKAKSSENWMVYWDSPTKAKEAMKLLGETFAPYKIWMFAIDRDKILNFGREEAKAKWGSLIQFECRVSGPMAFKHRHELHAICLPGAVAAIANYMGYENSGFDLRELCDQDLVITDELQVKMLGSLEKGKIDFFNPILYQKRAELWKSLGENDPSKYSYQVNVNGKPSSDNTQSEKLGECLQIFQNEWKSELWGRVILPVSPVVSAFKASLPVIAEIFETKKEAETAAQTDIERFQKKSDDSEGAKETGVLKVPVAWADAKDDFLVMVKDFKKEYGGKPRPIMRKEITKTFSDTATVDEIEAWLTEV